MLKTDTIQKANLHTIVRKEVVDVIGELLSDPDAGLELIPLFERKLKKSVREKVGGKVTPLSDIFAQFSV